MFLRYVTIDVNIHGSDSKYLGIMGGKMSDKVNTDFLQGFCSFFVSLLVRCQVMPVPSGISAEYLLKR